MAFLRRAVLVFLVLVPVFAFAQSADQEVVSAADSPDPVEPGATLTYTVTLTNHGPDPATGGGLNINLPLAVTHQNSVAPAGFTCNYLGNNGTCNMPSLPVGTYVITINVVVNASLAAFPDQDISATFFPSGTTVDPNNANNSKTATTTVDSDQVDLFLTVTDSPDPVFPDGTVTYTVPVTNGGPDTATSVNFNVVPNSSLAFQSATVPAGWNCTLPAVGAINATFTCTRPSFAPGTSNFTVVFAANDEQFGINDTPFQTNFNVNAGASNETDNTDNSETETTQYVTPDADLTVAVTDAPDPVGPDGDITYTVTVQNTGPDTATNVNFNVFNNNTLRFQSATVPGGWNCTLPAVDGNPTFTCTNPSFANGASSVFTVVVRAYDEVLGINDGTVQTVFSVNSSNVSDPDNSDNSETESTSYVTPDADLTIAVTDSPDPVLPDGDITYTVTVQNTGPDTATNVNMNVFNNNTLRFQSATVPAGWNCTLPAVDGNPTFTCTNPSFANGASSVFTVVLRAYDEVLGINDGTVQTVFSVNSSNVADPDNSDNSETESTSYVTPDANVSITATDSPDPVVNGQNVAFTVNAANAGPDAAPNATITMSPHPSLTFQSLTAAAGWSCTTPAVDAAGVVTCTRASMASGETPSFTLVTKLVIAGSGGTLTSTFSISSNAQDPTPANNSVNVNTSWIGQTSDLGIGKATLSTAAAQGSNITYTISALNHGPDGASNVTITDVLHPSLRFVSLVSEPGWSCTTPAVGANGTITCTIATFPDGADAQFSLTVSVDPNATGSITNSASISSTTATDPVAGNSSSSAGAVAVAGNADLGVTKSTVTTSAPRGGTISYTIVVSNAGPEPAASVSMTDTLPATLLFQSIAAPAGWSCTTPAVGATGTITCTASTLASGASATFTLNATVANTATGNISNSASATHSGTDGNAGNNSGTSAPVAVDFGDADLGVTKTTATTTVAPGATFSYTIAVTNAGPDAATNAVMTDTLPASLLFQSITAAAGWTCTTPAAGATGTITCTAATFASGATANFTLTVEVAQNATGTITNTAAISSASADPNTGNDTSTTPPLPVAPASADLVITKTTASTNVTVGTVFGYTITVANSGPSDATSVVVNDTLPSNLEFVSATPSQGTCNAASPLVCNLGTIAAGNNATIDLQVRAIAAGNTTNTATVTSPQDGTAGNNSDAAPQVIVVGGPADQADIPTLSEWMLIALMLMLGVVAVIRMRT